MIFIAITSPKMDNNDAYLIKTLLEKGVDIIHLRKPDATICECRKLLNELTNEQRAKIVIHDYLELYNEFSLKGIHINRNIANIPIGYNGFKTRSCHTFDEIKSYKNEYDYLFLSPIFDSISKVGYKSSFSKEELEKASEEGIIDEKVVALGGVTFDVIPYLKELNFGGVAMLGGIYNIEALKYLKKYKDIQTTII